jgi:hypothetical protein
MSALSTSMSFFRRKRILMAAGKFLTSSPVIAWYTGITLSKLAIYFGLQMCQYHALEPREDGLTQFRQTECLRGFEVADMCRGGLGPSTAQNSSLWASS